MPKKSFVDVLEEGTFDGDFDELRALARAGHCKGKWTDLGKAKQLIIEPESSADLRREVYFWPDTGNVLHAGHSVHPPSRQSSVNWKRRRNNNRRKDGKRWSTIEFKELGKLSLPQLVIHEPEFYFETLLYGDDDADIEGIDIFELAEMFDKTGSVKIPPRFPKDARVIHEYDNYCGEYDSFEITNRRLENRRKGGLVITATYIDLNTCATTFYSDAGFGSPIESLQKAVARRRDEKWDRETCDNFFSDPRNFIQDLDPFDDDHDENPVRVLSI